MAYFMLDDAEPARDAALKQVEQFKAAGSGKRS